MVGDSLIDLYLKDERKRTLYQGLMTLPQRQREILEIFYFSEMSIKEIAFLMKLTPENVRVLAHLAKKILKTFFYIRFDSCIKV